MKRSKYLMSVQSVSSFMKIVFLVSFSFYKDWSFCRYAAAVSRFAGLKIKVPPLEGVQNTLPPVMFHISRLVSGI